jgi:hypothetical protein
MRLTLSQENEQYGRKILQMNHLSYKEMRGSTAVQYCHSVLPWQYPAIRWQYELYCLFGHTAGGTSLPWLLPWPLVSFYEK